MGPSRYDHLVFCLFQRSRSIGLLRGCVALKKKPSGERLARKPLARFNFSRYSSYFLEQARSAYLCSTRMPTPVRSSRKRGSRQESSRVISTARLRTLPPVHLPPIYVVVCNDPTGRSYLEVGFVLRCFQHLSVPDAATRPCPWRDNRLAGGRSNTVLSY